MAWCPKCKNEYREGITVCADCKADLVEMLEEEDQQEIDLSKGSDFFEDSDFPKETDFPEGIDPSDAMAQLGEEEMAFEEDEIPEEPVRKGVYQKKEDKAEDLKSTAFLLIAIGIIGIAVLALCFFGVIPLRLNTLTYVVMTGMFLIFILSGIGSKKSYQKVSGEVDKENSLTEELLQWCRKELTVSVIDQIALPMEEISEEIKYFKRMEVMKKKVNEKFMNLDADYLDTILDEYYQEIYED